MLIDVHNHVMPAEALDLLRRDPGYGVTIDGDRWTGVHHVPFTIAAAFHDPAAKIAEMDAREIGSAVLSCPPPLFFYEVASYSGASVLRGRERRDGQVLRRLPGPAALAGQPAHAGSGAAPRELYRGGRRARLRGRGGGNLDRRAAARRARVRGILGHGGAARAAGARASGLQRAPRRTRAVLPAERDRQPAGDHGHGGADDLRRGVRPPSRRCGWSCCTAAATCRTRPGGWPTPAGCGRRSR